jgi:hypothetical protein
MRIWLGFGSLGEDLTAIHTVLERIERALLKRMLPIPTRAHRGAGPTPRARCWRRRAQPKLARLDAETCTILERAAHHVAGAQEPSS